MYGYFFMPPENFTCYYHCFRAFFIITITHLLRFIVQCVLFVAFFYKLNRIELQRSSNSRNGKTMPRKVFSNNICQMCRTRLAEKFV